MESLLRRPDVERRVGLRRSMIYRYVKEGRFPAPVRIGKRAVAWRQSDIEQWIKERTVT